ncbi:hypothetical protein E2C01_009162 [Portunus trituberculatus]|uniref:Uncharacterized protein n=1 Tax=Portunus trituberculatus TaxID=210409 RepID=A0A5B7D3X2_PORTR|nr:hypothetical protein [Portunus trituberculatus]
MLVLFCDWLLQSLDTDIQTETLPTSNVNRKSARQTNKVSGAAAWAAGRLMTRPPGRDHRHARSSLPPRHVTPPLTASFLSVN